MEVTVAICTWNRAKILDQTLGEFCKLQIPSHIAWELLVVNNRCTDATDAVIAEYETKLPVRRLFEAEPGKALAANRAIAEAKGETIIWADDDVLPVTGWLSEYVHAFEKWPDCAVFGGPIFPFFEGDPPAWLDRSFTQVSHAFGLRDFGDQPLELTNERIPYGANFAVRRSIQTQFTFDPQLGVKGFKRVGGYETSLLRRILANGLTGRWVPGASLRHFVRKETQTTAFLRHYYAAQGAAAADDDEHGDVPTLFGMPRWLFRRAIQSELKYRFRRLVSPPEVWIEDLKTASKLWGRLRTARKSRRDSKQISGPMVQPSAARH